MLNTILTNDANVANFFMKLSTGEAGAAVEEKTEPQAAATTGIWFLSTGNLQDARIHLQYVLGTGKTANVTGPVDETLNWLDKKGVRIESTADVRSYLLRYSDLLLVIPPVWKKASSLLLPSTQFTLALYRDPEISDEYLTLYARQREYQKDILDVTFKVNAECEMLLSGRSGCLLTTTDFHTPK